MLPAYDASGRYAKDYAALSSGLAFLRCCRSSAYGAAAEYGKDSELLHQLGKGGILLAFAVLGHGIGVDHIVPGDGILIFLAVYHNVALDAL